MLLAIKCKITTKKKTTKQYNAKFVIVRLKKPNKGALKPIKLVTSNCSNGEDINNKFKI